MAREFKMITPARAQAEDGTLFYSASQWLSKYEQPQRYCLVSTEGIIEGDVLNGTSRVVGANYCVKKSWHMKDGSTVPMTELEAEEVRQDIMSAIATGDPSCRVEFVK